MIRALFDTSAFVAALINPVGASGVILLEFWAGEHAFDLLICSTILAEYRDVAARPHIVRAVQRRGAESSVVALLQMIEQDAIGLAVDPPFEQVCADPDDDVFFACARAGSANYLVSLDRTHILPLGEYAGVALVSPAAFLDVLRAQAEEEIAARSGSGDIGSEPSQNSR